MDTTVVGASAPGVGPEVLEVARAVAEAAPAKAAKAKETKAPASGAERAPEAAGRSAAARTRVVARGPGAIATAGAGYAKARATASATAAKATKPATAAKATKPATAAKATKTTTAAKATSSTSTKSLEDKLFEFLKDYVAKVEKQLDEAIEGTRKQVSSTGGGGSLLDVVTGAVPVLGQLEGILGKSGTRSLLGSLGAGILGGIASVIGTPALGAIVTQVAPTVIDAALGAKVGSSATSKSTSSSGTSEQLQLMEVQRLQSQLQRMVETVSNVLKSRHDTLLTAIHNLR